jgi:hypothetical protein
MNHKPSLAISLALALLGCNGMITDDDDEVGAGLDGDRVTDNGSTDDTTSGNAPMVSFDMTESDAAISNPERGYYVGYDLTRPDRAPSVRASGRTLAISVVGLDNYRDRPIDAAFLASLDAGFDAARANGFKIILRFNYNSSFTDDAPKSVILGHIDQLEPLLREHADVIAVMQGGFIGAWGEWHGSTNGLDNPTDRAAIINALLAALPPSRNLQLRRPIFKDNFAPGGPLDADEAWDGSDRARLGHHNDCFLASSSDYGTYSSPVDTWKQYVADDGRYVANGGETCAVYPALTDCNAAKAEMERLHWSYLNQEYNQDVLAVWDTQGCAQEIDDRLGYRFAVTRVGHTERVAPGGILELEVDVMNRGYAAPFNQRPVEVVLDDGTTRRVARLAADARTWAAGVKTTLTVRLRIPADIVAGPHTLSLRLPDAEASLADDPRYAIQLANDAVWSGETGDNVIIDALMIDTEAPGPRDPSANELVELR